MKLITGVIIPALCAFLIDAGAVKADSSGGFNFRAGIGYDYISQEYFLDSLRYLDTDSSLKSALLRNEYLDDKKGFIFLNFNSNPVTKSPLNQKYEIGWEQTGEIFRLLSSGRIEKRWTKSRIEADVRLEMKKRYRGETQLGEDLTMLNAFFDYRQSLTKTLDFKTRIHGESVIFDTVGTYIYNYTGQGIEIGLENLSKSFNSFYVNSAFEIRTVPDSSELDFKLFRSNLGYSGSLFTTTTTVNSNVGMEIRDYHKTTNQDSYFLLSLNSSARIPIGASFNLIPIQNLEHFNFEPGAILSNDYYLAGFGLSVEKEISHFSISIGPEIELLRVASSYENDDDYTEIMAAIGADYFGFGGLFFMIDNKFGRRLYKNNPDYFSDFIFNRANLIGSAKLIGDLNFDILLSLDFEFHDISSDDNRLYLLSSGFSYQF